MSKSLIDHVLLSSNATDIISGTIISDVSDHFFTFVHVPGFKKVNKSHKTISTRDFSLNNHTHFKTELGTADWNSVAATNDIDLAYDGFWTTYNTIFEANFPLKRIRFNKNRHKINNFMTRGILV